MARLRWYLRLSSLIGLGFLILSYQNCGNPERFSQAQDEALSSGGSGSPQSCSSVLQTTTENLKVLFMYDNSDSTKTTDPDKYFRVTVLQNFLAEYGSKTNFQYSFSWFAPTANIWNINKNSFQANAQSSISGVQPMGQSSNLAQALTAFSPLGTQSGTNYANAFAALKNIVDLEGQASGAWKYVVVFGSDGQPTNWGKSPSAQLSGIQVLVSDLLEDVQANGSEMIISSVYFGSEADSTSINNLSTMASMSGGQFVDTNQVTDLQISDLITVPGQVCTPSQ